MAIRVTSPVKAWYCWQVPTHARRDSLKLARCLRPSRDQAKSIDLIFTSYNTKSPRIEPTTDAQVYADNLSEDEYQAQQFEILVRQSS